MEECSKHQKNIGCRYVFLRCVKLEYCSFLFISRFLLGKIALSMFPMYAKWYDQCQFFIRCLGAHEFDNKFILNQNQIIEIG